MYKKYKFDHSVMTYFKRIIKLDANQPIELMDLLMACPAYSRHGVYGESDLKEAADLMERCLKWDPSQRITATDALKHPFCHL